MTFLFRFPAVQYTRIKENIMIIVGIIGEQGAGKGTIANYLEKKYSAFNFRFSRALDDILKRLSLPNERTNQIALVTALRGAFGEDILAKTLAHDLQTSDHAINVVEGIRMPSELAILTQLPQFHLWHVTAPIETRYRNVIARGEKAGETQLSFEEFKQTEQTAVTEIHIPELAKKAETTLENTGSIEELCAQADAALAKIQK